MGKGALALGGFAAISNNALGFTKATFIGKNISINYLDDTHVRIDSLNAALSDPWENGRSTGMRFWGNRTRRTMSLLINRLRSGPKAPPKTALGLSVRLKIPDCLTMDIKLGSLLSGSASEVKTTIGGNAAGHRDRRKPDIRRTSANRQRFRNVFKPRFRHKTGICPFDGRGRYKSVH